MSLTSSPSPSPISTLLKPLTIPQIMLFNVGIMVLVLILGNGFIIQNLQKGEVYNSKNLENIESLSQQIAELVINEIPLQSLGIQQELLAIRVDFAIKRFVEDEESTQPLQEAIEEFQAQYEILQQNLPSNFPQELSKKLQSSVGEIEGIAKEIDEIKDTFLLDKFRIEALQASNDLVSVTQEMRQTNTRITQEMGNFVDETAQTSLVNGEALAILLADLTEESTTSIYLIILFLLGSQGIFFLALQKRMKDLVEATGNLASNNALSFRLTLNTNDQLGKMAQNVNHSLERMGKMVSDLQTINRSIEVSNNELQEQREWFATTLASIGDAVITTDANGQIHFMNPVAENLTEWTQKEAINLPIDQALSFINEVNREPIKNPALQALKEDRIIHLQHHTILITKNRREIPIDDSAAPIKKGDTILGAVLIFRDITERKQLLRQLQEREKRFRTLYQKTPIMMHSIDKEAKLLNVSDYWLQTLEYKREEVVGKPVPQFFTKDSARSAAEVIIPQFFETGEVWSIPYQMQKKGGEIIDVEVSAVAEYDENQQYQTSLAVLIDVTERNKAQVGLEAAKKEAEDANRAKSEFLANMSHELRTPMHSILAFSNLGIKQIQKQKMDAEMLEEFFTDIRDSGENLLSLLNALLDLSKLESGEMEFDFQRNDLYELTRDTISGIQPLLDEKQLSCHVIKPEFPMVTLFDPMKISQVILNLLANAIKFSPQGKTISIEFTPGYLANHQPAIETSVKDQGIGIPENELEHIFDEFIQSSSTRTTAGGTGLGLPICRKIVAGHQGVIYAKNNPEGGTTLTFTLPVNENSDG